MGREVRRKEKGGKKEGEREGGREERREERKTKEKWRGEKDRANLTGENKYINNKNESR